MSDAAQQPANPNPPGQQPSPTPVQNAIELHDFFAGFEPKSLLVTNPGLSAKDLRSLALQEEALEAWMREVTALLSYQPSVPLNHKIDLCNAMQAYRVASGRPPKPTEERTI